MGWGMGEGRLEIPFPRLRGKGMGWGMGERRLEPLFSPCGRRAGMRGSRGSGASYFACLPLDLRYLKNSEVGSSTSTSFRPRKLALYASRLR